MPKEETSRKERKFRKGFHEDCAAIVSEDARRALAEFKAECAAIGKK